MSDIKYIIGSGNCKPGIGDNIQNPIEVIPENISFDSTLITFDSTIITFDNT